MQNAFKEWVQENQPYIPAYILSAGILGLGLEAGVCAIIGHKELIDPIAVGVGVVAFVCYFVYLWREYRSFEQ